MISMSPSVCIQSFYSVKIVIYILKTRKLLKKKKTKNKNSTGPDGIWEAIST